MSNGRGQTPMACCGLCLNWANIASALPRRHTRKDMKPLNQTAKKLSQAGRTIKRDVPTEEAEIASEPRAFQQDFVRLHVHGR